MTSSQSLSNALAQVWYRQRYLYPSTAGGRMLGSDVTTRGRRTSAAAGRWATRAVCLRQLQAGGAQSASARRAGPTVHLLSGRSALGLLDAQLRSARVSAARSFGRLPPGTGSGARLALCLSPRRDPLALHAARAGSSRRDAQKIGELGPCKGRIEEALHPWRAASSPAEMFWLTLCRVG